MRGDVLCSSTGFLPPPLQNCWKLHIYSPKLIMEVSLGWPHYDGSTLVCGRYYICLSALSFCVQHISACASVGRRQNLI